MGASGCSMQYHLNLSDDATVLKRNGVTLVQNATLCIDLPAYVGCAKLPFYNGAGLDTRYFRSELGAAGVSSPLGQLLDIELNGMIGDVKEFGVVGTVTAAPYSYSITWDFTSLMDGGLDLSAFNGCNMALSFEGVAAPPGDEGRALTGVDGFPNCDGFSEQCSSLCGRLTLCGTSD